MDAARCGEWLDSRRAEMQRVWATILASALSLSTACSDRIREPAADAEARSPWRMHAIDDRFRGANALGVGDLDADGLDDYVSSYEFDQRVVVALNPGDVWPKRRLWPRVIVFQPDLLAKANGVNPESAALGDFDGDGAVDVVVGQGWAPRHVRFWEGSQPGVRIVWGPGPERALDRTAWLAGGLVPATRGQGHFNRVVAHDVDRDGLQDIVAGGRLNGANQARAGISWLEAPDEPALRRDLALWRVHAVDPETHAGHGFVFTDVDADGDDDIINASADFDTPPNEERITWLENPGPASRELRDPWPKHVLYEGDEFHGKPQIALGDLDGDGLEDFATQTRANVYWFRKTSTRPVRFERIVIEKDPIATWTGQTVQLADLNGDGRIDILGMLTHEGGEIPASKASVFWMQYTGTAPGPEGWITHAIKWGSGVTMLLPQLGEKWDQARVVDVDRDGDLDIVANLEDWWQQTPHEIIAFHDARAAPESVSVVWFENQLREPERVVGEEKESLIVEAEEPSRILDGSWIERARHDRFHGHGYLQAFNALHPVIDGGLSRLLRADWPGALAPHESAGVQYQVEVEGGDYWLWIRRRVPADWGYGLGGSSSNAAWLRFDDDAFVEIDDLVDPRSWDHWRWVKERERISLAPGRHVLTLRVRERGYAIDRLVLTKHDRFHPVGTVERWLDANPGV